MPPSRHLVVGPGAMGRLLAIRLAATEPVVVAGRRPLPAEQTLITPEGETITRRLETALVERLPYGSGDAPPEFVHLTTKAYATEAAFDAVAGQLPPDTPLVLWQNGYGVQERLGERWTGPLLCATTSEGAHVQSDRQVTHAGHGQTYIGSLAGRHAALAERLAARLTAAGLAAAAVADIRVRLWRKLAVNAALNPLVARFRIRNGQLRDRPFRPMAEALIDEIAAIMAAEGITPPEGAGVEGWRALVWRVVAGTANNRASMLQDVLAGRPTERDAILGPLLASAQRHGLAVPRLTALDAELAESGPR